jgi:hypothetical protein
VAIDRCVDPRILELEVQLSEPAAADRLGIGFGWLQNACRWLLQRERKQC